MSRRLVVLTHEYPPFRGGIGTYCKDIARAYARMGHPTTVIAPDFHTANQHEPVKNLTHELFKGGVFRHRDFPRVLLITLKAIRRNPGALFHAADWPFVAACGLLRRFFRFDYIATVHGSEILFFRKSKPLNALTLGNPFHKALRVCANSHYTAGLLRTAYPVIPNDTIAVTHLGVDPFWSVPTKRSDRILKAHSLPTDKTIILSVGRLHPRKGQHVCIEALGLLPEKLRRTICYVIVGSNVNDTYSASLKDMAGKAGFPVCFVEDIPNEGLRELYARADIFALASEPHGTKVEGFGLVFLEAACFGVPSVAIEAAAVPEVVLENKTGLLAKPRNIQSFAAALQRLIEDKLLLKSLGKAAKENALIYTWDRTAVNTLAKLN